METTATVRHRKVPYRRVVGSDGSIEITYRSSRLHVGTLQNILAFLCLGVAGFIVLMGVNILIKLHLMSIWAFLVLAVVALGGTFWGAGLLVERKETITIVPGQGFRFQGQQLAYEDCPRIYVDTIVAVNGHGNSSESYAVAGQYKQETLRISSALHWKPLAEALGAELERGRSAVVGT